LHKALFVISLPRVLRRIPRAAGAQSTVCHFYDNDFEKKRERAAAAQGIVGHFYAKVFKGIFGWASQPAFAFVKTKSQLKGSKVITVFVTGSTKT
jgi:hypothetical protein